MRGRRRQRRRRRVDTWDRRAVLPPSQLFNPFRLFTPFAAPAAASRFLLFSYIRASVASKNILYSTMYRLYGGGSDFSYTRDQFSTAQREFRLFFPVQARYLRILRLRMRKYICVPRYCIGQLHKSSSSLTSIYLEDDS